MIYASQHLIVCCLPEATPSCAARLPSPSQQLGREHPEMVQAISRNQQVSRDTWAVDD
jgi:hypothetical protein